jgi:Mn-dependent DtxR family transcriptional regulator
MREYKVKNNENGKEKSFDTMDKAQEYQEYLVFTLGIDAEVL